MIRLYEYQKPINTDYTLNSRSEYSKATNGLKRSDSLHRTRNLFIDYIETNKNPYTKLLTLTTKEPIYEFKHLDKQVQLFVKNLNNNLPFKLQYIYVVEGQKKRQEKFNLPDAPLHLHMMIFNRQKIPYTTLKKYWPIGSVDIQKVRHIKSMGRYMAKYLSKETLELNKKGFRRSLNLKKPETVVTCENFPWQETTPNYLSHYTFNTKGTSTKQLDKWVIDLNSCSYKEWHNKKDLPPLVDNKTGELITFEQWFNSITLG